MSQILRIRKTKMVEKEYLVKALQDLELAYDEGSLMVGTLIQPVEIKLRGRNVGFRKTSSFYEVVTVRDSASFLPRLMQRYIYHAARAQLETQGFTLVNEAQEKGQIHLVLRRMA